MLLATLFHLTRGEVTQAPPPLLLARLAASVDYARRSWASAPRRGAAGAGA